MGSFFAKRLDWNVALAQAPKIWLSQKKEKMLLQAFIPPDDLSNLILWYLVPFPEYWYQNDWPENPCALTGANLPSWQSFTTHFMYVYDDLVGRKKDFIAWRWRCSPCRDSETLIWRLHVCYSCLEHPAGHYSEVPVPVHIEERDFLFEISCFLASQKLRKLKMQTD